MSADAVLGRGFGLGRVRLKTVFGVDRDADRRVDRVPDRSS